MSMVEIKEDELNYLVLLSVRWVIRTKNYQTSKIIALVKRRWHLLDKDTKKLIKSEIRGRIKTLSKSHQNPTELHYFNSYVDLLDFITDLEQQGNVNG